MMKEIPDGLIDMGLCDPPYGTTNCKWDIVIPFAPLWEQLLRITKCNAAIVMTASQPFTSLLVTSNIQLFKTEWIWSKNKGSGHLNAKKMPMKFHESILVFYRKPPTYNPQKTTGHLPSNKSICNKNGGSDNYGKQASVSYGGNTDRHPRNILNIPVVNNDSSNETRLVPTQKPVALMEYLIKTYTNDGDTVLDFAMGSGTTGVASKNLKRNFIGIELSKPTFKIAKRRIKHSELRV